MQAALLRANTLGSRTWADADDRVKATNLALWDLAGDAVGQECPRRENAAV
jgi:hypothetical protein